MWLPNLQARLTLTIASQYFPAFRVDVHTVPISPAVCWHPAFRYSTAAPALAFPFQAARFRRLGVLAPFFGQMKAAA